MIIKNNWYFCIVCFFLFPAFCFSAIDFKPGICGIIASTGYSFGVGGYHLGRSVEMNNNVTIRVRDHYLNAGSGMKITLGADYYSTENLGAQLLLDYTFGAPSIKIEQVNQTGTQTETYSHSLFDVKIIIAPQFAILDLLDAYVGIGPGLYAASVTSKNSSPTQPYKGEIGMHATLGLCGVAGFHWPLDYGFTLFSELQFEQVSLTTKFVRLTSSPTQIDHIKNSTGSPNPEKISGSTASIKIGVRYVLVSN